MNSLTLGFFYVVGLGWALVETSISASNGNWTPLTIYLIGFSVMFSVLGCWPISDEKVNVLGAIFAVILGLILVLYAVAGYGDVSTGTAIAKLIGAIGFLIFGIVSFFNIKQPQH